MCLCVCVGGILTCPILPIGPSAASLTLSAASAEDPPDPAQPFPVVGPPVLTAVTARNLRLRPPCDRSCGRSPATLRSNLPAEAVDTAACRVAVLSSCLSSRRRAGAPRPCSGSAAARRSVGGSGAPTLAAALRFASCRLSCATMRPRLAERCCVKGSSPGCARTDRGRAGALVVLDSGRLVKGTSNGVQVHNQVKILSDSDFCCPSHTWSSGPASMMGTAASSCPRP